MSLLIKCPTEFAVLFVGADSGTPPLMFPVIDQALPGISFRVDSRLGINEQLLTALSNFSGQTVHGDGFDVDQRFTATVNLSGGDSATLYLARWRLPPGEFDLSSWQTMPEILRNMPKDRNRIGYVKAWQVLTGALSESTKAIDIRDIFPLRDE